MSDGRLRPNAPFQLRWIGPAAAGAPLLESTSSIKLEGSAQFVLANRLQKEFGRRGRGALQRRNNCACHVSSWRDTLRRVPNFLRWIGHLLTQAFGTPPRAHKARLSTITNSNS